MGTGKAKSGKDDDNDDKDQYANENAAVNNNNIGVISFYVARRAARRLIAFKDAYLRQQKDKELEAEDQREKEKVLRDAQRAAERERYQQK